MRIDLGNGNYAEASMETPLLGSDYQVIDTNTFTYTIPNNEVWQVAWAHLVYTSTATAGTRYIEASVLNEDGNPMIDLHSGATQTASKVYHYTYLEGIYRETSFITGMGGIGTIQVPIPSSFFILPGWSISFGDEANIDVHDTMVASFVYRKFNV